MALLVGWLLMMPPIRDSRVRADLPVTDWTQYSAYDSAKQCEREKVDVMETRDSLSEVAFRNSMKPDAPRHADRTDEGMFLSASQARDARCVPAAHIYPPKK